MLPADPYEWIWLLAIAVVVVGGSFLERWLSRREPPVAAYLVSLFWTAVGLALAFAALIIRGLDFAALLFFAMSLGSALRTAFLYAKRGEQ